MRSDTESRRAAHDAYERWAFAYAPRPHNPLMVAEQRAMLDLFPDLTGRRVLDLASGSGRYTQLATQCGAREVIALDLSPTMLERVEATPRVQADMMQLPFASASFDVVIAGLAIGHIEDPMACAEEIARVLVPRGVLLYSDFHPSAAAVGLKRSFKDASGTAREVPHHRHELDVQRLALATAGFAIDAMNELRVGVELRETFPGSEEFYARWLGLPLVLVVRAHT